MSTPYYGDRRQDAETFLNKQREQMSTIERVARAIARRHVYDTSEEMRERFIDKAWPSFAEDAKAALLSLSSPEAISEGMVEAMFRGLGGTAKEIAAVDWAERKALRMALSSAISAALQEQE